MKNKNKNKVGYANHFVVTESKSIKKMNKTDDNNNCVINEHNQKLCASPCATPDTN